MCSYCGCRDIGPIGRLHEEHVVIMNLMGEVRRAVERDDLAGAVAHLERLIPVLAVHDAVEEVGVYPAMSAVPALEDKVAVLFDEHDDLDGTLDRALDALRDGGPGAIDWPGVLGAFDTLWEHIDHEENGMFPAAAIALDPQQWEHAEQVRRDVERGTIASHHH
ncbi:hemerythrin domain-containing protein [Knoellia subterranea]|uniref:Hemerythrin n=1 Tax=Knoellia subterranea KCTC 19937 TaxID=1385521 RepID=A0A0A0JLE6_9MICO|nr:hemerythrin domain-containing protein [Knoellia subterranea]KGN37549.1 hemerythrin [Knoellia subterranea KCTC 19937]